MCVCMLHLLACMLQQAFNLNVAAILISDVHVLKICLEN